MRTCCVNTFFDKTDATCNYYIRYAEKKGAGKFRKINESLELLQLDS